jgi:hypothetical protein
MPVHCPIAAENLEQAMHMTAPKTIRLNPREAPKGYRAVEAPTGCNDCDGCDFLSQGGYCKMRYPLAGRPCFHERRKDGHNVIFKRVKKARKP